MPNFASAPLREVFRSVACSAQNKPKLGLIFARFLRRSALKFTPLLSDLKRKTNTFCSHHVGPPGNVQKRSKA
jgi:hypothetical protein